MAQLSVLLKSPNSFGKNEPIGWIIYIYVGNSRVI